MDPSTMLIGGALAFIVPELIKATVWVTVLAIVFPGLRHKQ